MPTLRVDVPITATVSQDTLEFLKLRELPKTASQLVAIAEAGKYRKVAKELRDMIGRVGADFRVRREELP